MHCQRCWRAHIHSAMESYIQFRSCQSLSRVPLFVTPWTAAAQASLSITKCQSLLKHMSIESVMPYNQPTLCYSLLLLLSRVSSASGSFQMSQFFISGGQRTGVSASASVVPINIQDWFPLRWTSWISLQTKRLSRVFSNTTVQNNQYSALNFLYSPTLTSIHDYQKNYSFDYTDLGWQSNVSVF